MMPRQAIQNFSFCDLAQFLNEAGEKPFRAGQIWEWIYQKGVRDFGAMTNLPAALRARLDSEFIIYEPKNIETLTSRDGTRKFLFELDDGERIESALIPTAKRNTLCVSSQAGCKFKCAFCASGMKGFKRQLSCAEILSQILYVKNHGHGQPLTHIVFMGVGEPLDNYDRVLGSIRTINFPQGLGIAARRITISTCGLIPQMKRLTEENLQIELSVSLHGYDDASRRQLMPVSRTYPIKELIKACRDYIKATNRQITFEYILIKDLTCTPDAARALGGLLKGMLCKMNLIPVNQVREFPYGPPSRRDAVSFRELLIRQGIHATIRAPRGQDIAAACGQLRRASNQPKD